MQNNEVIEINYFQDAGHGWIEVSRNLMFKTGFNPKDISSCSYENRQDQIAYLEEDCDAGLFLQHLKDNDYTFTFKEIHNNNESFIRRLPSFKA